MKRFIVVIAALTALVGCRKSIESFGQGTGSQIDVTAAIDGATGAARMSSATRASKDVFANKDSIGLWVVPYSNSQNDTRAALRPIDNYQDNVLFEYNGTAFKTVTPIFYPNAVAKVDIYSVMPYQRQMSAKDGNTMTDPEKFVWRVKALQTGADSVVLSDLMTSFVGGAKDGSNPQLLFKHRLSQVLVKFTVPEIYKEKKVLAVTKVELVGAQLASQVSVVDTSLNPTLLAVAANPKTDVSTYKLSSPTDPDVKGDYVYEGIIPPQKVLANTSIVRITLNVEGLGDVAFDCKTSAEHEYVQKKKTEITVNIESQTTIVLGPTAVTIQGWGATAGAGGSTIKMSKMYFDARLASGTANMGTVKTAKLTLDDSSYVASVIFTKVDDKTGRYTLEYDQRSNWGGRLRKIEFNDELGVAVVAQTTFAGKGLQIMGDPTGVNYDQVIGVVVFATTGNKVYGLTDDLTKPANCHVVGPGCAVQFNGKMRGNWTSADLATANMKVLWQTAQGHAASGTMVISDVIYAADGTAVVTAAAGAGGGNAVVAAYDVDGAIIWSWHIWVPASTIGHSMALPAANQASAGGNKKFMDRNLGAINATVGDTGAYGMLYQWGRKDPFTPSTGMTAAAAWTSTVNIFDATGAALDSPVNGVSETTGFKFVESDADNLAAAIENPMNFYHATNDNWTTSMSSEQYWKRPIGCTSGYVDNSGAKGLYDPCPAGYRIAGDGAYNNFPLKIWTAWDSAGGTSWLGVWWPAAGYRGAVSAKFYRTGHHGWYWSSSLYSNAFGYGLAFEYTSIIYANNDLSCGNGLPVRCVTE